ncbi:hypothetical protein FKP32DRAFT_1591369 [Trametes sanguinea]|nr:hypothetical protein FKP32DRAFT_1591369 [Trametes sanguinea]
MEGHQPLHTLTGGDDYIRAFLQIVNVHHHCWCKGIRHGVWTPDDLTYLRAQDGSVQGMLHDWDVALPDDNTDQSSSRLGDAPGATHPLTLPSVVPFMAVDLLTPEGLKGDVAVLYRHELESFIWVLIWAVCCYHNGTMIRSAPDGIFGWDVRKPLVCGALKRSFLAIGMVIKPASDGWVYGAMLAYHLASYLRRKVRERAIKRDAADDWWRQPRDRSTLLPQPTADQEKDDPEDVWTGFWTWVAPLREVVPCIAEFMPKDLHKARDAADELKL